MNRDTLIDGLHLIDFDGDALACGAWLKLAPKEERAKLLAICIKVAARHARYLATPALLGRIRIAIREQLEAMPESGARIVGLGPLGESGS